MNENETMNNSEEMVPDPEEQLKEVMKTMVPRTELDEAKAKYNSLYKKVLSGEFNGTAEVPQDTTADAVKAMNDAFKEMSSKSNHSCLEHMQKMLDIHNGRIAIGERPVLSEDTASAFETIIELADGDNSVAAAKLSSFLSDVRN